MKKGHFHSSGGEVSLLLRRNFSHYCGVQYGVGVGSGTDALCLALKAAGIGEGDEGGHGGPILLWPQPSPSPSQGQKPLFVDIDPKTYTMDPDRLELLLKTSKAQKGTSRKIKAHSPCSPLWPSRWRSIRLWKLQIVMVSSL